MEGTWGPQTVSTKLQRIAEQAIYYPEMVFTTLMHHINTAFLFEAYCKTKKNSAPGLSGITAAEYEKHLKDNLRKLSEKVKAGTYKAPPLKRVWIEKEDNSKRPTSF